MARDNVGPSPQTPCRPEISGNSMAEYDSLPAPVRKLLADAPYDFATHPAKLLVDEKGIDAAVAIGRKNAALYVEEEAAALYGAEHPQARRSHKELTLYSERSRSKSTQHSGLRMATIRKTTRNRLQVLRMAT